MKGIDKELFLYVNSKIKPLYKSFDKGHNISHYNFVVNNCINYSKKINQKTNLNMLYVVGAYHDIGLLKERENHSQHSGEFLRKDKNLKKFFLDKEIEIMAQAVEDHSSNNSSVPRNIYGKIVADADRNNSCYLVFSRPLKYGIKNNPKNWTKQQHIERVFNFVEQKFGPNGYVKYWLNIEDTRKEQQKVWDLLSNKKKSLLYIEGLFDEIVKGKIR